MTGALPGSGQPAGGPLGAPLSEVVGPRAAKSLKALGLETVEDLLRHYPRRYATRGQLTDLAGLRVGEQVTVLARVSSATVKDLRSPRSGGGRPRVVVEVDVTDGHGRLQLTFFNQRFQAERLRPGRIGLFAGKVGEFRGMRQLQHPDYQLLDEESGLDAATEFATALIPVYPATEKVPSWQIQRSVQTALPHLGDLTDPLDSQLRRRFGVIELAAALAWIHRPEDDAQLAQARDRLRWDEAFEVQLVLARRRADLRGSAAMRRPGRTAGILDAFDAQLMFELTAGQREVGAVLAEEISRDHPMHRLLQGEVGSGKTVVALRAMLQVVDSGGQAVLLAPTEVLAAQHARTIAEMLGPLGRSGMIDGADQATRIALITGSLGAAARRAALLDAASGQAGIVVGTHALLEDKVQFADLGLVVVDEQHRFGVEQRAVLAERPGAPRPHVLVMTATPIPRTVAMTVFGDLDVSTLRELPSGRAAVATHVVAAVERPDHLARAWQRAREEVQAGRQVFVVCPRIDPGVEEEGAATGAELPSAAGQGRAGPGIASVSTTLADLTAGPLRGLRVAALTGRMSAAEKEDVMQRFRAPQTPEGIDVLVATTVIEVGVDVPNASMMVVLDADRFGISQLHQLRGRIGRGSHPGLCLLVTSADEQNPSRERLAAVAANSDGFELARFDLMSRSEGDILGAAQSGSRRSLRLLSVLRDEDVIVSAKQAAGDLIASDPELSAHPLLAAQVARSIDEMQADYLARA